MSTLLWMISFLLHGISILAIYLLLKDKQRSGGNEQTENMMKETLEEIRRENKRLQNLLEESNQQDNYKEETKQAPLISAEQNPEPSEIEAQEVSNVDAFQTVNYQDEVETSLEAKILQLHAKGETTDSIAKKLNCGKTEAEIIIKLHQKKSYE